MCNEFLFSIRACLDVWLLLLFKVFFIKKMYQNNIFFIFKKIIFDINASKWSKNTKKILIWSKEKNKFFFQKRF